jgi:hypothetical protein
MGLTTQRKPDYARDRVWEKEPGDGDGCVCTVSDPYVSYMFGSDHTVPTFYEEDTVRYC